MTTKQFLHYHRMVCGKLRRIAKAKNADYSGFNDEVFKNFRMVEKLGVCTAEEGILVRMSDKMSRIATFLREGDLKVKDESVKDTLDDLCNYAIILRGLIDDRNRV